MKGRIITINKMKLLSCATLEIVRDLASVERQYASGEITDKEYLNVAKYLGSKSLKLMEE